MLVLSSNFVFQNGSNDVIFSFTDSKIKYFSRIFLVSNQISYERGQLLHRYHLNMHVCVDFFKCDARSVHVNINGTFLDSVEHPHI